ncbi:MAG TPA: cell division protein FtsL [Pyrinomonadaceae bacterium]|jgi:cell division protein FtsL
MRRLPAHQLNYVIHRERDWPALRRLALLLLCGLMLAGGFVFAAGQHFAAVRYGYQTEALRREQEQLMEEQRRLLLEREQLVAPARLEGAAREIGLQPVQAAQIDTTKSAEGVATQVAPAFVNPSAALGR